VYNDLLVLLNPQNYLIIINQNFTLIARSGIELPTQTTINNYVRTIIEVTSAEYLHHNSHLKITTEGKI